VGRGGGFFVDFGEEEANDAGTFAADRLYKRRKE
jgi:hypothetical protein